MSRPLVAVAAAALLGLSACTGGHDERVVQPVRPAHLVISPVGGTPPPTPPHGSPLPVGPGFTPTFVAFWDELHGIAGGSECAKTCTGAVEVTSNGGRSWRLRARTPGPVQYGGVIGRAGVWTATDTFRQGTRNVVMRSDDRGRTWRVSARTSVSGITFVRAELAFGFLRPERYGDPSVVWVSRNAGRTWTPRGRLCLGAGVAGLSFVDDEHGWAYCAYEGGGGQEPQAIFRTEDGGRAWEPVAGSGPPPIPVRGAISIAGYPAGLQMHPNGRGWAWTSFGSEPYMRRTADWGATWSDLEIRGVGVVGVDGASFPTDDVGFLITHTGAPQLRVTHDGGRTWGILCEWKNPYQRPHHLASCD